MTEPTTAERFEDWLRLHGAYPQGTTIRGAQLLALADLVAAVRALRDAPRDGSVDIAALHRRQEAALDALDEEARR